MQFLISILFVLGLVLSAASEASQDCRAQLALDSETLPLVPRHIDTAETFRALTDWIYNELIVARKAPGLVVGISGTDSILVFLACAKAFEKAGRPERAVGMHYGDGHSLDPKEMWFQTEVVPWLQKKVPGAKIIIDSSIDSRRDGLRVGALMDWSVIDDIATGTLRAPKDRYWVVGTRNRTEDTLMNYSNLSTTVSAQVIQHLWKSEVLQVCKALGVPKIALDKSCEADCACGRDQLPAMYIPEVDALLMVRLGLLNPSYVQQTMPQDIRRVLSNYIESQIAASEFKKQIPYRADPSVVQTSPGVSTETLLSVQRALTQNPVDPKPLAQILPSLLSLEDANATAVLGSTQSADLSAWLPEALMLFNSPHLRSSQQSQMLETIFGKQDLSFPLVKRLSRLNAAFGSYGFRFPQWRFLTQSRGETPTLAEQFGMRRLVRATDQHEDGTDFWGPGFIRQSTDWYVEYRRAYLLVSGLSSTAPITVVIRNSSFFFGRDRLPEPVFISWQPLSVQSLQNLSMAELKNSNVFMPWQNVFEAQSEKSLEPIITRIERALKTLEELSTEFDRWLWNPSSGGRHALLQFLNASKGKAPIYFGQVPRNQPSWLPKNVVLATDQILSSQFESDENQYRWVMMSGAKGDFP